MSLTEQQIQQIQGENGTEYTLITTPLPNGDEVNYQVIQAVNSDQQENIDPQTQVLMLQPSFTVASDQFGNDQNTQYEQVQILPDHIQGQVAVPLSEGQLVDGQYQQVLFTTGPDGQQHQIIIHQEVAPQAQHETQLPTAPEQPKQQAIQPPVGKGPFRCDICDKVFPKWNQLQRHLRSHEDDKPHRCPHCPDTFNVEDNLRLHKATHSNTPVCPECGKKFSRIASLKAHIMLHEKEENLMCTECGDEFSLQTQLDRHMAEHREEQDGSRVYHCRQCSLEFSKHSIYRDHMKQHNKVKSSLSHRTYKRNIDRSGFNHKCNHCGKTFQKPSQLLRHGRIHTGERPFKCSICDKAFNQKGARQIHMSKHTGQRPHTCEFCPMTFSQKGNLRAHIRRVHSTPKDADTPVFNCEECSCVFRKLGSLNAHMSRMHSDSSQGLQEIAVQYMDQAAADKLVLNQFNKSEIIVANNLQGALEKVQQRAAQAEGKNSNVNSIVVQQLLELDGPDAENVQQQINQIAVGGNISSDILQQALENSGLSIVPQSATSAQTEGTASGDGATQAGGEGAADGAAPAEGTATSPAVAISSVVVAKDGQSTLRTLNILDAATGTVKKHVIRKVNGVRWHQCTYCAKEFKKPSDLVRHIRIHTHEKPYKCNQCFRAFAVKSTLTAHIKTHTGTKEHKCPLCDKHFSTVGSLRVHTRLHTGDKPFACPHCEKKFRTSGHCKSHIASHFKEASPKKRRRLVKRASKPDISLPDIPLQEPILITDTGWIQQAPRHSQFYNQYLGEAGSVDRPYKCGYCSRGFKKSSHLKQHIRSHTGEKPYKCVQCMRSFISSGVLKAHVRTHTGEKCYKCLICEATFTTNGSLKRHMSTHSEVRPFMCPYCQKTFKTSVNCKKHMKTHRHELALQALQTDGGDKDGDLATTDHEVPEPGGEEEHEPSTPAPADTTTFTQPETSLQQVELATLQQQTLTQDQQLQSLSQTEYNQQGALVQQDLTQPTVIQDALVSDAQLQSTLNQQVLGNQQVALQTQQQAFTQSLLNTSTSQQTFNQLNFTQPQFSLQNGQNIDVSNLTAYSQATPTLTNTLTSTNMSNILQPREAELASENQPEEPMQEELDDLKRSYKCPFCNKGFKKSSHLKQHVRSHTGEKPFFCKVCNRTFVSHGVLKAHMKTHTGTKDFQCHVCSASFTTNGSLTRHMMLHSTAKRFKCPLCSENFRTAFLCKKHMRSHREKNDGDNEDAENDRPKRSRSVIQITEEEAHELSKAQPTESLSVSEKLLIESAAEKDRVSEMKMEKEIVRVEPEAEPPAEVESTTDPTYTPTSSRLGHRCRFCPKGFRKPSDLVRHTRIHTGEKPFDCPDCGRRFTVKSTLDSHLRTHTTTEKKFKCHVCQSCFSTKGSLKVHMRLHTGAKPFKCPHCEQRFRTSGHRKSHIAAHFKPSTPKKQRKYTQRTPRAQPQPQPEQTQQVDFLNVDASMLQNVAPTGTNQVQIGNQIINIDQSLLQGQNLLPVSLNLESLGLSESGLAAQVLQGGLDGVQLQVAGNVGQNIQIQGLDPNTLTQTIQIDAGLLAQLQQGTINLSIAPNILQTADPNLVQNIQVLQQQPPQPSTSQEVNNPNVIIQQYTQAVNQDNAASTANPSSSGELVHQVTALPTGNVLDLNQLVGSVTGNPDQVQHIQVEVSDLGQAVVHNHPTVEDVTDAGVESEDDEEDDHDVTGCDGDGSLEQQSIEQAGISLGGQDSGETQQIQVTLTSPSQGDRVHFCDVCKKGFRRAGHLRDHMNTHNPGNAASKNKFTPHVCPTCNKGFSKPSQLQRHIRIHTGERPFVCQVCQRAFNQKNALQIHMKKHNGERPHKCPYCDQAFTQKGNLKTHIKRAHHVDMVQAMNITSRSLAGASGEVHQDQVQVQVHSKGEAGTVEGMDLDGVVNQLLSQ